MELRTFFLILLLWARHVAINDRPWARYGHGHACFSLDHRHLSSSIVTLSIRAYKEMPLPLTQQWTLEIIYVRFISLYQP